MIELTFSEYEAQIDMLNAEIVRLRAELESLEARAARTNSPYMPAAG